MNNEVFKSMLNPVRIRIIQELIFKKQATTKALAETLNDIPQATLYRHLAILEKNKVITVVAENRIRGALEKVYALDQTKGGPLNLDPKTATKKDISDLFTQFTLELLSDFEQCLNRDDSLDKIYPKMSFSSASMYLTDQEFQEMISEVRDAIMKRVKNIATPERELKKLSFIYTTASKNENKQGGEI